MKPPLEDMKYTHMFNEPTAKNQHRFREPGQPVGWAGHYHTFWLEGQEAFWDQVQLLARRVNGLQGQTRAHWHLMYTMADLGEFCPKRIYQIRL